MSPTHKTKTCGDYVMCQEECNCCVCYFIPHLTSSLLEYDILLERKDSAVLTVYV